MMTRGVVGGRYHFISSTTAGASSKVATYRTGGRGLFKRTSSAREIIRPVGIWACWEQTPASSNNREASYSLKQECGIREYSRLSFPDRPLSIPHCAPLWRLTDGRRLCSEPGGFGEQKRFVSSWQKTGAKDEGRRAISYALKHDDTSNSTSQPRGGKVKKANTTIDFGDPQLAHGTKSWTELLRAITVLNLCRSNFLVDHASSILDMSYRVLGKAVTNAFLRPTFYKHFCAGETAHVIKPQMERMRVQDGVGSILDYVAESDDRGGGTEDSCEDDGMSAKDVHITPQYPNQPARTYDYQSEMQCDHHRDTFLECIRAVRDVSPERGFAALKVTALGNPKLLERLSVTITEVRRLFEKFDLNGDGLVTREEFETGYRSTFVDAETRLPDLLDLLDPDDTGGIDYITWSKFLSPSDIPDLVSSCKQVGPLALSAPSPQELCLLEAMHSRAHDLAQEAALYGTRLLFDAEQTYYQPAIDNLVLELQQKYNSTESADFPLIYNTYQCYLKDTPRRLQEDVERSRRYNYHFGCKLVRGAYMVGERRLALERGCESPIHDTLDGTHACYDDAVAYLLRHHHDTNMDTDGECMLEVMCATHNQESVERTLELMEELDIPPNGPTVTFAQLLGMADHLTFPLGREGYRSYKYVPYGAVHEAVPYLLRRAEENRSMLSSDKSVKELGLLYGETRRRVLG